MNAKSGQPAGPIGSGPLAVVAYVPGVCNIGPAEIRRRRLFGHLGLAVSLALLAGLIALGAPHLARLLLIVPAAGAATGYLQAWLHFCAGFGSAGTYNFGPLGTVTRVEDPAARARDRRKSMQIGLVSLAIGVAAGLAAVALPL
jgi:hypothetical protein